MKVFAWAVWRKMDELRRYEALAFGLGGDVLGLRWPLESRNYFIKT
jgi:hypothetical protein